MQEQNSIQEAEHQKRYRDEKWFREYQKLAAMPGLGSLRPQNRKKEKFKFFRGEVENPSFTYVSLESFDVAGRKRDLESLLGRIEAEEDNEVIRELYRAKIEYKLDDCTIVESIQTANDKLFDEVMKRRHGDPSPSLAGAVIDAYLTALKERRLSWRRDVRHSAKELYDYLADVRSQITSDEMHSFKLVDISLERRKILHALDIKKVFETKKQELGLDDWSIELDVRGKSNSITVHHKAKKVVIPRGRRLKESQVRALAEHELGVHIQRRVNGERTDIALLGVGFAGFLLGEEGIAKYYEREVYRGSINSSLKSYLLLSLALGVDGKQRDFREIYAVSELIFRSMCGKYFTTEIRSARHYAWGKAMQLFRGTTGTSAGVCFRRQLVYLEGFVRMKEVFEQETLTKEEVMLGKYDPANGVHVENLRKLGVLPQIKIEA